MSDEPIWRRYRDLVRRKPTADVDEEVRHHLDMRRQEALRGGLDAEHADAAARERFGNVDAVVAELYAIDTSRERRRTRVEWFGDVASDIRFAARSLWRAPGFTAAAVATLALGVGAALAVFNVVNGVLLRRLPYDSASRIQMVWITDSNEAGETWDLPLSSGFYLDIERQTRSFEAMAAFRAWTYALTAEGSDESESLAGARVSPSLFSVLGIRPIVGQPFTRNDALPGRGNVAMISHDLWQRRFGGDEAIVGKRLTLNGQGFTVTGVMPPGFAFPRGAELTALFGFGLRTQVWTPLVFDSSDAVNYGTQNLSAVGRLPGNGSALAAQTELSGIMKRFLQENAPRLKLDFRVLSLADQAGNKVQRGLLILLGAVILVLAIATANVASLLIARIGGRQRELAVRAALGAGRLRIARQLVTENLVLAIAGTILGLFIAYWTTQVMLALVPGSMPRADDVGLDWRVLSVAALVTLIAGAGFGAAAAFAVQWSQQGSALHESDLRSTGGVRHRYGRRLLAATEVALSLMLLIGAALLTRSFIALQNVRLGFDPSNMITMHVGIPIAGRFRPLEDGPAWSATMNDIAARVAAAPGVIAAGMVSALPLSGAFESGGLRLPGVTYENGQAPSAQYNVVVGDYFKAADIRLIAGRTFDATDLPADRATIVINRVVAQKLFGSESAAIGREVRPTFEFNRNRPPRTIVGIVDDVKQLSADEEARPQVYVPQSQMSYPGLTLVVRASSDAIRDLRSLLTMIKREARAVNPAVTVDDVRHMEDVVSSSMARQRFNMTLVGVFAALALVLSIVGLYGVVALIVGQRRREIGVRIALGAQPHVVMRMILQEGAVMAAVGVTLGIFGALALTRVMEALLFGISTTDPWTFVGAAALVTAVALGASYVPARRAARVDPKTALVGD